jgi:hypothetical protein
MALLACQPVLAVVAVETVDLPRSGHSHNRRVSRATEDLFLYAPLIDIEPHDSALASIGDTESVGIRPLSKPRHRFRHRQLGNGEVANRRSLVAP